MRKRRQENGGPLCWLKRGFGWDREREDEIPWRIARKLRLPLSRWLRIGRWFGGRETCRKCGIEAKEAEYAFRRVGVGGAECLLGFECEANLPKATDVVLDAALAGVVEAEPARSAKLRAKTEALKAGEPCPSCGMRHADPLDILEALDPEAEPDGSER